MSIDTEKAKAAQPVPDAELDRRLFERAEHLMEGRKTFGGSTSRMTASAFAAPEMSGEKENEAMKTEKRINEVKSRRPAAILTAAAVMALIVGGAAFALKNGRGDADIPGTDTPAEEGIGASSPVASDAVEEPPSDWGWYEKYLAYNLQLFGYMSIPGLVYEDGTAVVDFPIAKGEDNEFYRSHAFDMTADPDGCIFADAGTDTGADGEPPQIIQLYGSSLIPFDFRKDDTGKIMFGLPDKEYQGKETFSALLAYTDIDVLRQAPIIDLSTIFHDSGEYAVIGLTRVSGDAFGIGEVRDISEWVGIIRGDAYFDCDIDCGADDRYLVLDLYFEGRTKMRIFAKKLDESDDKEKIISSYRLKAAGDGRVKVPALTGLTVPDSKSEERKVSFNVPLPQGIRSIYTVSAYIDGRILFESEHSEGTDSISFEIPGEGSAELTVMLTDPLSSDLTNNSVEYARYSVDFDSGTAELTGELNTAGALDLLGDK